MVVKRMVVRVSGVVVTDDWHGEDGGYVVVNQKDGGKVIDGGEDGEEEGGGSW